MIRKLIGVVAFGAAVACESPTRPGETAAAPAVEALSSRLPRFRATSLGTLGGDFSVAYALNNLAGVAGGAPLATGEFRAFLWRPSTGIRNLGSLGGSFSVALDINDLGVVVGGSDLAGDTVGHAFLWTQAQGLRDLGVFPGLPPVFGSGASAINNRGEIVGVAEAADNSDRPFLLRPGRPMQNLGTLGGHDASAFDLNDFGQVVGSSLTASGDEHAFLWTARGGMKDLGTLGGSFSVAIGISQTGAVTGYSAVSTGSDEAEAFLWTPRGGMKRLGTLGGAFSGGSAVNSLLRVAGSADTSLPQTTYPALWTPEHGVQRLPTVIGLDGDGFGAALSINEFGVMAGYSRVTLEKVAATIWTPVFGPLAAERAAPLSSGNEVGGSPETSAHSAASASAFKAKLCGVTGRQVPKWSHLLRVKTRGCGS